MGTYKTNWQLNETVMPEDFNRIETNIKENNKNHDDLKNEYEQNLKEINKKIESKPERGNVLLKVPYPSNRDCNSFKNLNTFFSFDTSIGSFKNTPLGNLEQGSSKIFIVTNRGHSKDRIQQEWVQIYPQNKVTKYTRNFISGEWGNWYKNYDESNKPTWNDVSDKPSTFTPSSHNHDNRYLIESESDSRYANKNDVLNSSMSEPLETNDQTFNIGYGMIPNTTGEGYINNDYRNTMKNSLITIDNIYGETVRKNYKLWDVNLSNMAVYSPSDEINIFSQPVYNNNQSYYDVQGNTLNIRSSSTQLAYVQFKFTVDAYTDYMLAFDVIEANGNSWVAVATTSDGDADGVILDIAYADGLTSSVFNTGGFTTIYVRFYSNVQNPVANMEVSYQNAKLIKVKDYIKDNIVLRSIPNGVRDRLKNGKITRRIGKYVLTGLENWRIIDTQMPNTNVFACKLPDSINNPDKTKTCLICNKFAAKSDSYLATHDEVCMSMGGIGGELIFRVGKGLNTVEALRYYLNITEKYITVYYEITPRTPHMDAGSKDIDVNTTMVAESGDKVILGTPVVPVSTYHQVQLSTQAQIQETQKQVSKAKKTIWSKLKGLLDGEFQVGHYHSYIKLPSLLGGFIFQWGFEQMGTTPYNYIIQEFPYPIVFPNEVVYVGMGYMRSQNSWQDLSGNAISVGGNGDKSKVRLHVRNTTGNNIVGGVSAGWFAIGR
ncbi:hypothetical protein UMC2_35211 [[Clostridium] sordellii]|uniref:gp53-like domain-containing protein n=1 Tax=Paraclostridium sordellii TaxID=1505 RepID=UPI0005425382|nr:hypothetical protein [Paeniclostridium sordellii]CEK34310.1 hypothetical protein UMC2_35211 [[Clostridium] sordellii] [Paeniclostridium sordellii]